MRDLNERAQLARFGVHMPDTAIYAQDAWREDMISAIRANPDIARGSGLALDAQPQMLTTPSAAIPAFLANIVDPNVIEVVLAPLRASEIAGGEVKKGDWTTVSLMMPLAEMMGYVVSYGDYDNGGTVDANVNWVNRQPYHYQAIKRMGDREQAVWGVAGIDWSARKDRSRVDLFRRFQNRSYFSGVLGLQNYGMLNDPSLITPITPATKAAGGTTWANATPVEIYNDILALFTQLQIQMGGNLEMTDRMTLALSTTRMVKLGSVTSLTLDPVMKAINAQFPNLKIEAAPEYGTASGELMQLILTEYQGEQTIWTAFTEKDRAFPVVRELSAWMQKFMAGTWGAIIRRPIAVSQMLGI